jgi:hypothetical protein
MALRSVLSSGVGVSLGRPATRRSRACTGPLRVVASQQQVQLHLHRPWADGSLSLACPRVGVHAV